MIEGENYIIKERKALYTSFSFTVTFSHSVHFYITHKEGERVIPPEQNSCD